MCGQFRENLSHRSAALVHWRITRWELLLVHHCSLFGTQYHSLFSGVLQRVPRTVNYISSSSAWLSPHFTERGSGKHGSSCSIRENRTLSKAEQEVAVAIPYGACQDSGLQRCHLPEMFLVLQVGSHPGLSGAWLASLCCCGN